MVRVVRREWSGFSAVCAIASTALLASCSRDRVEIRRDLPIAPPPTPPPTTSVTPAPSPTLPPPEETALAMTHAFIDEEATVADPSAVALAAEVHEKIASNSAPSVGCGFELTALRLTVRSPAARAAAHRFLLRVGGATKPKPWSSGGWSGERVFGAASGKLAWYDGRVVGVVLRGEQMTILACTQSGLGDADCPEFDETWKWALAHPLDGG